ncbi:hypothetical protein QZH41_008954 [Actinostola sp. cb2023]|nr:hypothetical protein QZH41_008954 [Actinostola sp. cb2023]
MKRLIRNQNVMIREQKRSIKSLKWQIRRKGTQERLDEIDRDVKHQTILLKDDIDVASLRAFKLSVDKAEAKLNRTSKSIKIRAKVISDMYFRLIMKDRRIDCKVFYTKWNKQADYKIGYLDKHLIECPNQEFLQEFLFERRAGGLDSDVRYKYRCCRYNIKDKWIPKPKND